MQSLCSVIKKKSLEKGIQKLQHTFVSWYAYSLLIPDSECSIAHKDTVPTELQRTKDNDSGMQR